MQGSYIRRSSMALARAAGLNEGSYPTGPSACRGGEVGCISGSSYKHRVAKVWEFRSILGMDVDREGSMRSNGDVDLFWMVGGSFGPCRTKQVSGGARTPRREYQDMSCDFDSRRVQWRRLVAPCPHAVQSPGAARKRQSGDLFFADVRVAESFGDARVGFLRSRRLARPSWRLVCLAALTHHKRSWGPYLVKVIDSLARRATQIRGGESSCRPRVATGDGKLTSRLGPIGTPPDDRFSSSRSPGSVHRWCNGRRPADGGPSRHDIPRLKI